MNAQNCQDFTTCYARHYYRIIKYIMSILNNWETAEDVVQDMFVKLYEKQHRLDPDSPTITNYLFSIARNAAIDYIKRESIEVSKYSEIHFEEVTLNDQFYNDVENAVIDGEIVSTLHDTIKAFPADERKIIIERLYDNIQRSRVCRKNNLSYYRVRMIEQNFIDEIQQKLQPYFTR